MQTKLSDIKYSGYQNIDSKDICIAMCYFNPLGYKNSLQNIRCVLNEFKKTNIPVFLIELIYSNQKPSLPYSNIVVKAETIFFVKENLWNILEKYIPDKYSKIIFMDGDVLCSDPNWVDKVSSKLNSNKIIHASEILYRDIYRDNIYTNITKNDNTKESVVKGLKIEGKLDFTKNHPGLNISINRDVYHQIGGFFEEAPGTTGDTLFWNCFSNNSEPYCLGFFCAPRFKHTKEKYLLYKESLLKSVSINDIDYLENNWCLHLYHGNINNRKYGYQDKFIPGIYTVYKNQYGVIEIDIKHPTVKDLRQYLESRSEDDDAGTNF